MDKLDAFISKSNYKIIFDKNMPDGLSGLCNDDTILINGNNSRKKQLETLAEEMAHQDTSVGDIIEQDTWSKRRQEKLARRIAFNDLVTLDDLIAYQAIGIDTVEEAADLSDVTVDFLYKALDSYREKRGDVFTYKGFMFDLTHGLNIYDLS